MKYCHNCGFKLTSGTEKFCPDCGQNLTQQTSGYDNKVSIRETTGDVIGTDISGSGHFIGKELAYTIQGNVINLHIGGGVSNEVLQTLQKIIAVPTQIDPIVSVGGTQYNKDIKKKQVVVVKTKQRIGQVLEEVDKISKKEGKKIQKIRAGDLHVSTKELLLKEIMLKGNEHYYKKEYSEAISWYDKAIKIDPKNADAWCNKGDALSNLGKYEEAIRWYDKAIKLDPNISEPWNNKGLALNNLGRYEEAIKCCDKAIEIDPDHSYAWNNKGNALSDLGKHEEAIKYYDKAIEIDPNNATVWNNKGLVLQELGKSQEAIKYYDKALKLDPNNVLAWNNKGLSLANFGKYGEAIRCYDKALDINPNSTVVQKNRDLVYKKIEKSRWKRLFGK